jgi:nucleoside-diphosphate-sugar epimerase
MRDVIGTRVDVTYAPTRHGDVKDSQADITRARTLLGYEPLVSFEEGLKKTVEWYRTVPS